MCFQSESAVFKFHRRRFTRRLVKPRGRLHLICMTMVATAVKNMPRTTTATEFENKIPELRAKNCLKSRV